MGNIIGINNNEEEAVSSTIPYLKKMEKDAKNLVLNIKPVPENNTNNDIFTETENYELYKIFEKNLNIPQPSNEFSETSPFISSDAYNNLMKNQKGGGDDDESSTSSSDNGNSSAETSDIDLVSKSESDQQEMNQEENSPEMTSDSEELVLTDTVQKPKKKEMESPEEENSDEQPSEQSPEMEMSSENMSTDSDMSTGNPNFSYLSSSAHTDNIDSSTNVTTVSVGNRKLLSDSINTSDINMISIDE